MTRRAQVLLATLCAAVATACTDPEGGRTDGGRTDGGSDVPATYVGTVDGSNARVALVHGATALEAYVCGKDETLATHTRWFQGQWGQRDAADLALRAEDWTLRIERVGEGLQGELESPDGVVETWTADYAAQAGASAVGLYDAQQDGCRTGVIVWRANPGAACQAQGSYCDGTGFRSQVTPVLCETDQPLRVRAPRASGEVELTVERVLVP